MKQKDETFSARVQKMHGLVICVGLIDGTLFPLFFAPTLNTEDYFTRNRAAQFLRMRLLGNKSTLYNLYCQILRSI